MLLSLWLACAAPELAGGPAPLPEDTGLADGEVHALSAQGPVAAPPADELGLTYEIYVRSFQDTDGDGVGDLPGVQAHLDHLAGLGVRTIWLMPVFPARGPAGYDVEDFETLTPEYGTLDDLDALVDAAHALGMRVLLDLPLNHTSRTHPWFAVAEAEPSAAERALYRFSETRWDELRWFEADGGGYYYGFFGSELPDLDWRDEQVRERMLPVWDTWLSHVDGYRLDAVRFNDTTTTEIADTDDTHTLLAELYARAHAAHPEARLLSEASTTTAADTASYLGSDGAAEADAVIDFPRREAMLAALSDGRPDALLAFLHDAEDAGSLHRAAPYLQSHDLSRLPSAVPDASARRLLQVLQLTLPGSPILYYGEELDLADATTATGQDYAWRAPMPWDASSNGGFTTGTAWMTPDPGYLDGRNVADAGADPASTLNLIRGLACVRPALEGAGWEPVATDAPNVFAYARVQEEGRVIVVTNLAAAPVGPVDVDAHGGFRSLTEGVGVDAGDGLRIAGLESYGYALYAEELAWRCEVPGPA